MCICNGLHYSTECFKADEVLESAMIMPTIAKGAAKFEHVD